MPAQKSMNAGPEQRAPEQERKKRRLAFALLLVLLPAAAGALHWLLLNRQPQAPMQNPNAVVGALPGKTAEQIEAMLNAQIDETTVAFSINSEPVFESGEAEGELMIECPEVNLNNIRVTIARDDTGEQVYDSGILQPNSYIYSDTLQTKEPLPAGSYACTATVHLLDRDTDEEKGIAQAALVITIER